MTERERFIKALKREPIEGHCPTFELVFFLTLEAIGKIHVTQQAFSQWDQMSKKEQQLHIDYIADMYIETARKYNHSAILLHPNPPGFGNTLRTLETIREKSGDEFFLMLHGDPTFAIPNGDDMLDFSVRIYEDPDSIKKETEQRIAYMVNEAEQYSKYKGLLDGFALCSDYCFNVNPFYSPEIFGDVIAPYLQKTIKAYHDLGFYSIKHTDGNIMPILDQIVQCGPDAIHSLDPQGGIDLGEVKRLYGDKVALCGNVNCGLLQTGTDEQVIEDVRRSLKQGMEGWGYIFCTSNCAYTGLSLERYELMHKIWHEEGIYK